MAKLSKAETRNHQAALEILTKDILTEDDKEFVFRNFHEAANNVNGLAGAFFTPFDLALDFGVELGYSYCTKQHTVIDLCAGIGMLAYAALRRNPNIAVTCVEINPDYVAIGRKLVPEATWIQADVTDVDAYSMAAPFDCAISNPPFGRVATFRGTETNAYTGGDAEFKVIELASLVARSGVFLIPQQSSGFRYSGAQCYERNENRKYTQFTQQTGIQLEIGMGIDTAFETYAGWKGVSPTVEICCVDFDECELKTLGGYPAQQQNDLFAALA